MYTLEHFTQEMEYTTPNKEVVCVPSISCVYLAGAVLAVCVVCVETHQQHRLVVTPVTSSLRGTHPPVSSTAVIIWRKGRERVGIEIDIFIIVYFMPKTVRERTKWTRKN